MKRNIVFALTAVVGFFLLGFWVMRDNSAEPGIEGGHGFKPALVAVTDMVDGQAYPFGHTFLCSLPYGGEARDWHLVDRWVKNQLSYDVYEVDGRQYQALRLVTNDPSLPERHVRFRRETIRIAGPSLEGHDYLKVRINGAVATVEKEVLLVEFNGTLEPQARPLPACGTPRS